MKALRGLAVGVVALGAACSGSSSSGGGSSSSGSATSLAGHVEAIEGGYKVVVEPFEVQPGEVMRCAVIEGLPEDVVVQVSETHQSTGGHHLVLYTRPTAQPGQVFDCTTAEAMGNARFFAPGPFDGTAENLAYRARAHQPIIVQSHYINATGSPLTVNDTYTMMKAPAAANPTLVDFFALNNSGFALPQGSSSIDVNCSIPKDLKVLRHFGHLHELGTHYTLTRTTGSTVDTLDDYAWETNYRDVPLQNIRTAADPFVFHAGDQLKLTCTWDNNRDHVVEFPEEMCVTFMHYLVDENWDGFLSCDGAAPEVIP